MSKYRPSNKYFVYTVIGCLAIMVAVIELASRHWYDAVCTFILTFIVFQERGEIMVLKEPQS